jgi:hypothetical protein
VQNNTVTLASDLPTELYEEFDHLLIKLGGKWKKGKGYAFDSDPMLLLKPSLAMQLVAMLEVQPGDYVLHYEANDDTVTELLKTKAEYFAFGSLMPLNLANEVRATFYVGNFLRLGFRQGDFDRCLLLPPLSKDVDYATYALSRLRPGGTLVAVLAREERRSGVRRLLEAGKGHLEDLPDSRMILKLVKS